MRTGRGYAIRLLVREHSRRDPTEDTVKIHVGNLSPDVTEDDLRAAFEPFGPVESIALMMDKFKRGEPRGFAFVEITDRATAESAIAGLNGTKLRGRALTVSEARSRPEG